MLLMQALDSPQSRAEALLQLVAKELGTSQWQKLELPGRSADALAPSLATSASLAAMPGFGMSLGQGLGMMPMGLGGSTWLQGAEVAAQQQQQPWSMPLQAPSLDTFNNTLYGGFYGALELQAWLNAAAMDADPGRFEQQQQQMAMMMNGSTAAPISVSPMYNRWGGINTGLGAIGSERGGSSGGSHAGSQHKGTASPVSDTHQSAASNVVTAEGLFAGKKRMSVEGSAGDGAYKEGDAKVELSAGVAGTAMAQEYAAGWGAQGLYGKDIWGHQPLAFPLSMPSVACQSTAPNDAFLGL
jgi:hypothetical protein